MPLSNPNKPVTEKRLQEFYHRIKDYLGIPEMPSEDMDEIITPKPSVMSRRFKYSTEEQIVGEWIDGKPIYQKTIEYPNVSSISASSWTTIDSNFVSDVDKLIKAYIIARTSTVAYDNVLGVAVTGTTVQVRSMTGQSVANVSPVVTYQYTKTTDQPNS